METKYFSTLDFNLFVVANKLKWSQFSLVGIGGSSYEDHFSNDEIDWNADTRVCTITNTSNNGNNIYGLVSYAKTEWVGSFIQWMDLNPNRGGTIERYQTREGNWFCFDHIDSSAWYESPKGTLLRLVDNPKKELRFARRWFSLAYDLSTNRGGAIWRQQNVLTNMDAVEEHLHPDLVAAIHGATEGILDKGGLMFEQGKHCSLRFTVCQGVKHWLGRIPVREEKTYGNAASSQKLWGEAGNGWIDVYISKGRIVGLSGTVKWMESFGTGYVATVSHGYLSEQRVTESWISDRKRGKNW